MSPNKRNNRMKEKEEDARLLKEELVTEDTGFITHWTQSPPCTSLSTFISVYVTAANKRI